MGLNYAFFCDAAVVDANGKLNVLGIYNRIFSSKFPLEYAKMTLVVSITGYYSEGGNLPIILNFIDKDGFHIIPQFDGTFANQQPGLDANIIYELNDVRFRQPGIYSVDIVVNNQHIGSVNLYLEQISE